jgi:proline iminopeptidase
VGGLVSVAAALTAGLLTPYLLAARTANLWILSVSAILSFAAVAWLGTTAALRIWAGPRTRMRAVAVAGILTVAFLSLPSGSAFPDVPRYENTRYWRLPSGSLIAYSEYDPPPGVAVKPEAIVYLHGGPGVRQGPFDQSIYGEFARQGFRVFLFDQAGSGLSGFLPHLRDYTVHRSIEDLEEVRRAIGVERMILIGHSWGSTLAASYMARYP